MPKPNMKQPYVTSNMNIPKNYLYTGNIQLLESYLASNNGHPMSYNGPLNAASIQHLKDRIANMKYIDELAQKVNKDKTKNIPKKAVKFKNGALLLTDIHQPKRQETGWNCWTMPFILMLQSRGIEIDQMTVRCMKPDLTVQQCMEVDPLDGTMFTMQTTGNIRNLAGVLHKFVPNAAMSQSTYMIYPTPEQNKASMEDFKKRVTEALEKHGSPVALLVGKHYRTIVGIDGDDLILKDSYSGIYGPDQNHKEPIANVFRGTPFESRVEISFVKDFSPKMDGTLPDELASHSAAIQYNPDGSIVMNKAVNNNHTGAVQFSAGGQAELGQAVTVGRNEEIRVGNKHIDVGETLYLPPKADILVADIKPIEENLTEEEELIVPKNEEFAKYKDDSKLDLRIRTVSLKEDLYAQSLAAGTQYALVDCANDSRQSLRALAFKAKTENRQLTPEEKLEAKKCVRAMVASRLFDVEKALAGKNTPASEKAMLEAGSFDSYIDSVQVQKLADKVFDTDAADFESQVNAFIVNDKASNVVRGYVKENIGAMDKEKQTMALQAADVALDPNHEVALLKGHLDNLGKSASGAWRNSTEYKNIKKCIENIIAIRSEMKTGDPANAEILNDSYRTLAETAVTYMVKKNPSQLKTGSVDFLKFKAALEVRSFANTQSEAYGKVMEKRAKPGAPVTETDILSMQQTTPGMF